MKMYIAVLDEVADAMTPTLVAHSVLAAHLKFSEKHQDESGWRDGEPYYPSYYDWLQNSFKKVVVRVNQTEFDRIAALPNTYLGHEVTQLDGRASCAVVCPRLDVPNVLKFARLWKPEQKLVERLEAHHQKELDEKQRAFNREHNLYLKLKEKYEGK